MQSQIKESSCIKYRNLLYSYILPSFSDIPSRELSSCQLQSFCDQLLTSGGRAGKGLSPKTVSDVLSVIRSILHYAQIQKIPVSCKKTSITITSPRSYVGDAKLGQCFT